MRSMSTAFDPVDLTPRRRSVRRSSDRVMRVRPSPTSAAERAFFRAPVGDGGVAAGCSGKALTQGIQRAGADIAIHDADRSQ